MTATRKFPCTCKHNYQDRRFGSGRRLYNAMVKDRKIVGWRCTVCGNFKEAGGS